MPRDFPAPGDGVPASQRPDATTPGVSSAEAKAQALDGEKPVEGVQGSTWPERPPGMTSAQWKAELLDALPKGTSESDRVDRDNVGVAQHGSGDDTATDGPVQAVVEGGETVAEVKPLEVPTQSGKPVEGVAGSTWPERPPGMTSAQWKAELLDAAPTENMETPVSPTESAENTGPPSTAERPPESTVAQGEAEQLGPETGSGSTPDITEPGATDSAPDMPDGETSPITVELTGDVQPPENTLVPSPGANSPDLLPTTDPDSSTELVADLASGDDGTDPDLPDPPASADAAAVDTSTDSAPEVGPILDGRLSSYHEARIETPAGVAFFTENEQGIIAEAMETKPKPGVYTVDMHGASDTFSIGGDRLDARDLAQLIQVNERWKAQPVRLISCETGRGDNPIAQELAKELGVPVQAPTELAWVNPDTGEPYTTSAVMRRGVPTPMTPYDGNWITFEPGDEKE